jgi:hypothetical protein
VWRPLAQRWRRRLLRRRGSENQARTGAVAAQWANRAIRGSIDFHARSVADRQERANTCPLVNSFRRCRRGISSRFRAAAHATRQLQGIKSTFGPRLSFACTSKLIPSLITSLMPRCVRSIGTAREGRRQASCSRRSRSSYGPLRAYFWAREASSRLKSRRWKAPAYGSRRDSSSTRLHGAWRQAMSFGPRRQAESMYVEGTSWPRCSADWISHSRE